MTLKAWSIQGLIANITLFLRLSIEDRFSMVKRKLLCMGAVSYVNGKGYSRSRMLPQPYPDAFRKFAQVECDWFYGLFNG